MKLQFLLYLKHDLTISTDLTGALGGFGTAGINRTYLCVLPVSLSITLEVNIVFLQDIYNW